MAAKEERTDGMDQSSEFISIQDLPEEILEQILSNLSPYNDLKAAREVCKQWHRLVKGVAWQKQQTFQRCIQDSSVSWGLVSLDGGPTIAERYSHCACYADKSVYVFGGCTSTSTTFNDLWRFDLATRQWIRPLAMGTYPSPKACASMVVYRDELVLFGGWNHPCPYPLHQAPRFFNELHTYSLLTNRWSHLFPQMSPRPVAGHSACVVQDRMVVFGGCHSPGLGSNDTWVYDFVQKNWEKQNTTLPQPVARYGQSQVSVDESHILLLGGCGGPNQIFSDLWLLSMTGSMWTWSEVTVTCPEFAPAQLWCHPACKVGDYAVVLSRTNKAMKSPTTPEPPVVVRAQPPPIGGQGRVRAERIWVPPRGEINPPSDLELHGFGDLDPDSHALNLVPDYLEPSSSGHAGCGKDPASNSTQRFSVPGSSSTTRGVGGKRKLSMLAQANAAAASGQDSSSDESSDLFVPISRSQRYGHSKTAPCLSSAGRDVSDDVKPGTSKVQSVMNNQPDNADGKDPAPPVFESSRQQARRFCGLSLENNSLGTARLPGIRPGLPSVRPNAMKNRTKQLDVLRRHADRIKQHLAAEQAGNRHTRNGNAENAPVGQAVGMGRAVTGRQETRSTSPSKEPKFPMYLHVLDLSRVVCHGEATWTEIKDRQLCGPPEETVFYSLVAGRGELLMFGGIQKDLTSMQIGVDIDSHVVRNDLYVISAQAESLR